MGTDLEIAKTRRDKNVFKYPYCIKDNSALITIVYKGLPYTVKVDVEDISLLLGYYINLSPTGNKLRVMIEKQGIRGKKHKLHRFIINAPKGILVDHINGNALDNRKINLRLATDIENSQNRSGAAISSKTGIRGVSLCKQTNKWLTQVVLNKKAYNLGRYDSIEEAECVVKEFRAKYMPFSEVDKHG
jgi:hypothetical protein